jgi:putative transcriptional regulator
MTKRIHPYHPSAVEVRHVREDLGLSREDAAALVHCRARGWQEWELGNRQMHPAMWELFCIKIDQPRRK